MPGPPGEPEPAAGVGLRQIAVKAPAPLGGAEEEIDQRPAGEQEIAHQEVLAVQNVPPADGVDAAPHIVPQDTGETEEQDGDAVDHRRLFPGPAQGVHAGGHDVFEHGDDGGKAGKGHEQEEQTAPQPPAGHVDKDVGQGLENQAGPGVDLHPIAEAGGEDDEPGGDGHKGVQGADAHALTGQSVVLAHIAAEDLHGGHPQAQGEEGLVHGGADDAAKTRGPDVLGIGHQIEPQPLPGAGKGHAVDRQNHDQHQ